MSALAKNFDDEGGSFIYPEEDGHFIGTPAKIASLLIPTTTYLTAWASGSNQELLSSAGARGIVPMQRR